MLGVTLYVAHLNASSASAEEYRYTPIVKAIQRARASVVNIHGQKTLTAQQSVEDAGRRVNGMGTGVVIDDRGYILTNYHVVEGVGRIQVTLHDRKTYVAQLVARDAKTDLAIIQIKDAKTKVVPIGTSSDLMPGETVIAMGNAFGYQHTVTRGIISALHRDVPVSDTQKYYDLIQTDASINPGNSGGPLLNINGDMIGINVAVRVGAQGIGFAIPVDSALEIAAQLLSVERVEKKWHGISGDSRFQDELHQFIVRGIQEDSPAAKGGLETGDVITSIGSLNVERRLDLERGLLGRKTGEEVQLTVQRGDEPVKISLVMTSTVRRRPNPAEHIWKNLGLRVIPADSDLFSSLNSRYRGGLKILDVRSNSAAARQGIRRGDVLVGMHVWETVSMENVEYVLNRNDLESLQPLKCYLLRGRETLYTHLPIQSPTMRQAKLEK